MRNIKLVLEYEGTRYVGWQKQAQPNSVQQAVEEAIERITGEQVALVAASRTDAGVHAAGQVSSFKSDTALAPPRLRDALNAVLPPDIAVLDAEQVPDDFNARFDATLKRYEYAVSTRCVRPAIARRYCIHCRWPLDLERMRSAARRITGRHDFAGFASSGATSRSTVRTITRCEVLEGDERLTIAVEGDGFLYNMVRTIAGTLIDVGRGKMPAERLEEVLASGDRKSAGRTAPARGLCLMWVSYERGLAP